MKPCNINKLTLDRDVVLACGLFCLFFCFSLLLLTAFCIATHIVPGVWMAPTGCIMATAASYFPLRSKPQKAIGGIVAAILLIALAIYLCGKIYDTAFDSYTYHFPIPVMLTQGWDPVSQPSLNGSLWCRHYAKAMEMIATGVFALTHNIASVTSVNIILHLGATLIMYYALAKCLTKVSRRQRVAIFALAWLNPVVIYQVLSGYNDFCLWTESVLLISGFLLAWKSEKSRLGYVLIAITMILAINTKFTHGFYIGLEAVVLAVWCIHKKRTIVFQQCCKAIGAALVIGFLFVGFSPYVANTLEFGNPIYPLGVGGVDIMTSNTPEIYFNHNRITNLAMSLTSVPDKPWAIFNGQMSFRDIATLFGANNAVNGFGVLMMPMLLIGLCMMVLCCRTFMWWLSYCAIFALSLCFEQAWWARYIPFLWLALMLPYVLSIYSSVHKKILGILRATMLSLAIAGGVGFATITLATRIGYTIYITNIAKAQQHSGKPLKAFDLGLMFRQVLDENNVTYIEVENPAELGDSKDWYRIYGNDKAGIDSYIALPEADYPQIHPNQKSLLDIIARYDMHRVNSANQ